VLDSILPAYSGSVLPGKTLRRSGCSAPTQVSDLSALATLILSIKCFQATAACFLRLSLENPQAQFRSSFTIARSDTSLFLQYLQIGYLRPSWSDVIIKQGCMPCKG